MRLFSQEIETWPCSVRRFGVVENGFVIWCDVQKNGETIIFFLLPLLSSQLMDARVSGLLNLLSNPI